MIAVPRRTGPHVGAARGDKGLGLPLDALATNLLNADVGGAGGGFGLRHDRFRDSLLMEARRAKFSVDKEFEVGVDRGALSAAHATTLRGAAAAEALRESGDVPDGLLSKDALELRVSARAAVDVALRAGASHAELQRYGQAAKGMRRRFWGLFRSKNREKRVNGSSKTDNRASKRRT